jgi:hypothetical protein
LNHTISIYDGQGNQLSPGHRSILGIPPVSSACCTVGTVTCYVLKYKTYWRNQGCAKGIQEWSTLLNHTISVYDGQGDQPSPGHRSILGIPPVSSARFTVGTVTCYVLKYRTYWRTQGCGKGLLQEWYILLAPTISVYDGQGDQPSPGHRSILGILPVSYARFIVDTISCCVLKYKPTGGTKDVATSTTSNPCVWETA